jgi:hypothetical protein
VCVFFKTRITKMDRRIDSIDGFDRKIDLRIIGENGRVGIATAIGLNRDFTVVILISTHTICFVTINIYNLLGFGFPKRNERMDSTRMSVSREALFVSSCTGRGSNWRPNMEFSP